MISKTHPQLEYLGSLSRGTEEKFDTGFYSPEIKQAKSQEHRDSGPLGSETQDVLEDAGAGFKKP